MSRFMNKHASSDDAGQEPEVQREERLQRHELEQAEVPEVLDFLQKHGITIVVSVALAVMAYVGYSVWTNVQDAQEAEAMNLLMSARSPEQLASIVEDYPESDAAPVALFSQASGRFDEGAYPTARDLFQRFADQYPAHHLAPNALLAMAQCDEALGLFDKALSGFEAFEQANPDHYLAPMARFGRGRCLEQLGRYDDAIAVFEAYLEENPDGLWSDRADTSIKFVEMSRRAAEEGQVPLMQREVPPTSLSPDSIEVGEEMLALPPMESP
jgi:TolA-binding protein